MKKNITQVESVFIMLYDNENRILTGIRNIGRDKKYLSFPGGMVKNGEDISMVAAKSLLAQTGLITERINLKHNIKIHDLSQPFKMILHDVFILSSNTQNCLGNINCSKLFTSPQFLTPKEILAKNISPVLRAISPEIFESRYYFKIIISNQIKVEVRSPQFI